MACNSDATLGNGTVNYLLITYLFNYYKAIVPFRSKPNLDDRFNLHTVLEENVLSTPICRMVSSTNCTTNSGTNLVPLLIFYEKKT